MQKARNGFIKNLRYLCLIGIIVLGLMTIIGTTGDGGNGDGDNGNGPNPSNTPPTATISSPSDFSTYAYGDSITFNGSGDDTEDGTLSGSSLVWTSSIGGQIGTGTPLQRNDLSVGKHTITLTATDSNGATGSDEVKITVNATSLSSPTNVSATPGDAQVTISWDSVSGATSYNIYWSTSSDVTKGTGTKISDVSSPYTHTGLTNDITCYYVVTAENSSGESDESDEVSTTPSAVVKLPDTGQTQSYTDTFGEDSDYTINPPSYTDNGDGTVTDNVTGLTWQQEDDDTSRVWDDAISYCNDLTLEDYSDWRLPSAMELMSIVNCGTYNPSIDTTYFPGTNAAYYGSSTTSVYFLSSAWGVVFSRGYVDPYNKSSSTYVRCVRGQEFSFGNFNDNGDGAVTDNNTELIWQQGEGGQKTWEDAISYCEGLSLAGYTDWRLPNKNELNSIIDYEIYHPAIDMNFFPGAYGSAYWSSTTNAYDSPTAWYVSFDYGGVSSYTKSGICYVRCVRGSTGDTWSTKTSMPTPRSSLHSVAINGIIYVAGGYNNADLATHEAYDPSNDTWSTKASLPDTDTGNDGRYGGVAGVVDGKLYLAGGWRISPALPTSSLLVYDPEINSWSEKASMPLLSGCSAGGVIDGKLYVYTACDGYSGIRKHLHVYDPLEDEWTQMTDAPYALYDPGAGVVNGKLYLIGGSDGSGPKATVMVYDPSTDTWTTKTPMPTARSTVCSVLNNKIYAIGGHDGSSYLATVEEYDPSTDTWTTKTSMPTARNSLTSSTVNNRIYAIGGHDGSSYLATVEEYIPPTQ